MPSRRRTRMRSGSSLMQFSSSPLLSLRHSLAVPEFDCSYQLLVVLSVYVLHSRGEPRGFLARNRKLSRNLFDLLLGARDQLPYQGALYWGVGVLDLIRQRGDLVAAENDDQRLGSGGRRHLEPAVIWVSKVLAIGRQ